MYDLTQDPHEQHNLAGEPAHKAEFEELKVQLGQLKKHLKDDDQFASDYPNNGGDEIPANLRKLGKHTASEAIDLSTQP